MAARRTSFLVILILALPIARLAAEEPASRRGPGPLLDESLGFSVNKLGLQNVLDLRWTWPLTASKSPILADAHLSLGVTHYITPSYTRLGAWVEVSPLSILDLRAGAEPGAYFGTFGSLMSFDSYEQPFGDDVRDARKDEARSGTGSCLYVSPTLKLKLGAIVVQSNAAMEWWRSSAEGPLYYEPARDTLLKVGGDRMLTTSTVLLRIHELRGTGTLAYGLGHNISYVFDAPGNRSQRIGLVAVRQFGPKRFGLHSPRIAGHVSYYLSDPSRKGQVTAALGVSMSLAR